MSTCRTRQGTHVPLLIRDPSKSATSAGKHASNTKAELVDLYRTLTSLAGLPAADIEADVDGVDLSSVLDDPSLNVRNYSFSQYSRCPGDRDWKHPVKGQPDWLMNNCEEVPPQNISFMGYTMRSTEYRYTMWFAFDGANCEAQWDAPLEGEELYSHVGHTDPGNFDDYENANLAANATYARVVAEHRRLLLANFRGPDKRVAGCPVKPPAPPGPAPTPLSDSKLVLERSEVAHDSELCGYTFCLSNHNKQFNYTTVSIEGYMPTAAQAAGVPRADLILYWGAGSHDNYVSTRLKSPPAGFKDTGSVVGQVLTQQVHGTVPLFVFHSATLADHLTVASQASLGYAKAHGYALVQEEPIGYVFAAPEWSEAM